MKLRSLAATTASHTIGCIAVAHATNAAFYGRISSFRDARDTSDIGGSRGFVMLQGSCQCSRSMASHSTRAATIP